MTPTRTHLNILMYSHDSYGLGHIRQTMALARSILAEGRNIILTGSPIVRRFDFPPASTSCASPA